MHPHRWVREWDRLVRWLEIWGVEGWWTRDRKRDRVKRDSAAGVTFSRGRCLHRWCSIAFLWALVSNCSPKVMAVSLQAPTWPASSQREESGTWPKACPTTCTKIVMTRIFELGNIISFSNNKTNSQPTRKAISWISISRTNMGTEWATQRLHRAKCLGSQATCTKALRQGCTRLLARASVTLQPQPVCSRRMLSTHHKCHLPRRQPISTISNSNRKCFST